MSQDLTASRQLNQIASPLPAIAGLRYVAQVELCAGYAREGEVDHLSDITGTTSIDKPGFLLHQLCRADFRE